jgi:hypothetical protein
MLGVALRFFLKVFFIRMSTKSSVMFLVVLFGVLTAGMLLVVYGSIVKNRWGMNFNPVSCPRCKTELPSVRKPRTRNQALWGGWTCPSCGTEIDKWGREVNRPSRPGAAEVIGNDEHDHD